MRGPMSGPVRTDPRGRDSGWRHRAARLVLCLVVASALSLPSAASAEVKVGAGNSHTCAIKQNDKLVCWGSDTAGLTSPPAGEFRSLSAGDVHNCAVGVDREVACWGSDAYGKSSCASHLGRRHG